MSTTTAIPPLQWPYNHHNSYTTTTMVINPQNVHHNSYNTTTGAIKPPKRTPQWGFHHNNFHTANASSMSLQWSQRSWHQRNGHNSTKLSMTSLPRPNELFIQVRQCQYSQISNTQTLLYSTDEPHPFPVVTQF